MSQLSGNPVGSPSVNSRLLARDSFLVILANRHAWSNASQSWPVDKEATAYSQEGLNMEVFCLFGDRLLLGDLSTEIRHT